MQCRMYVQYSTVLHTYGTACITLHCTYAIPYVLHIHTVLYEWHAVLYYITYRTAFWLWHIVLYYITYSTVCIAYSTVCIAYSTVCIAYSTVLHTRQLSGFRADACSCLHWVILRCCLARVALPPCPYNEQGPHWSQEMAWGPCVKQADHHLSVSRFATKVTHADKKAEEQGRPSVLFWPARS